jgi:hypothetical protein
MIGADVKEREKTRATLLRDTGLERKALLKGIYP